MKAAIIEANTKLTVPFGETGADCFMKVKTFPDLGQRRLALLAFGHQDASAENCWPVDPQLQILGQSFDHTIVDIEDCDRRYGVGDVLAFELDYTGLLSAWTSDGVMKHFIRN